MIKKILYCLIFLSAPLSWANEDVNVSISDSDLLLWDTVRLEIDVDAVGLFWELQLDIPGIEDFQVFSESQSQSYQNINGQAQTRLSYILMLRAFNEGRFTLGPIRVISQDSEIIDDEILTLQVGNTTINSSLTQNTSSIIRSTEDVKEKVELEDIRWLRETPKSIIVLVIMLWLFLISFYILLKKYFFSEQEKWDQNDYRSDYRLAERKKIELYFQKLQHMWENLHTQDFFHKYNVWMRKIFTLDGFDSSHSATLKELRKNKELREHDLFGLFEKTYLYEFHEQEVPWSQRKELIGQVIKFLQ